VASPTLYLFDGYNLLHAGGGRSREELVDRLAGFVALAGARGVVVFDGVGDDATYGALDVRFARSADELLERLAAGNRGREHICLVSSDHAIRRTAGQEVAKRSSKDFLAELAHDASAAPSEPRASRIEDVLDDSTRIRLERWRRRRT
jgi:predicted RNA-binding protein with PIN domain